MPSEYVVRWSGGRIGLGASVFHFAQVNTNTDAQAAANAIRAFFNTIAPQIPTGILLTPDPEVRVLNNDGSLFSVFAITAPTPVSGSGGTDFINGSGAMVRWNTSAVVGGRRLIGRTFLVPLDGGAFLNGNLGSTGQSAIQNAATALIAAMGAVATPLVVWSRANASSAAVTSSAVPTRPSSLRTRNDRD